MKKIKIYNILMYALWFSLFKITIIPSTIRQLIKFLSIILIFFYMLKNVKKTKYWINPILFFSICILLSSFFGYINNYITVDLLFDSIIYAACLFSANTMIKYGIDNGKEQEILNSLYNTMLLYVLCSLISIIKVGGSSTTKLLQYFAGNKFSTSYYVLLFDVLFAIKFNVPAKNKLIFILITICTTMLCSYLECSTTVVGSILLLACFINSNKIKKFLVSKKILFISLIFSAIAMLSIEMIIQNEYISYIITNILKENTTLTGRIQIYNHLIEIVKNNPILGYGYGNQIIQSIVGYGNAQNAIFQLLVQFGFLGLTSFAIIFYNSIKFIDIEKTLKIWHLYVFIYIMIFCSTVEISFNFMFYIVLFIIYAYNQKKV